MDRSIAAHAEQEILYDKPRDRPRTKLRITGPFTRRGGAVPDRLSLDESRAARRRPTPASPAPANPRASTQWRDELLKTGIRGKGGQMLKFAELETLPGTDCTCTPAATLRYAASAWWSASAPNMRALEQRQVELALREAGKLFPLPKMIVFCAFTFDPEAAKDIDEVNGRHHRAQGADEHRPADRRPEEGAVQQPELLADGPAGCGVAQAQGRRCGEVEVHGFDYFDTVKGELVSGGKGKIAMWSLDTDYDERACSRARCSSRWPGKGEGWDKLKSDIRAELDEDLLEQFHGTVSLPFEAGDNRQDRGEDRR